MNTSSTALAIIVSGIAGVLLGVAIFVLRGRQTTVAERVSSFVQIREAETESNKSLIERALGDKQARQIARSPFLERLRTEMEVAEIKLGLEQLGLLIIFVTVFVGWLLYQSTNSLFAVVLALLVPFLANMVIKRR